MKIHVPDENSNFPLFIEGDESACVFIRQSHSGGDELVIPISVVPQVVAALQSLLIARVAKG